MKTLFVTKDGYGVYVNSDKGEIKTEQNFKYRLNIRGIFYAKEDMEVRFEDDSKKVSVYKVNKGDVIITFYDSEDAVIVSDKSFEKRIKGVIKMDEEYKKSKLSDDCCGTCPCCNGPSC